MKILCCNIRVDVPADGEAGNGWDDRKGFCLEVIRAQNAAVICAQECRNAHYLHLKRGLPEYESFGLANPDTDFNPTNAVFFATDRFEMVSAGGFWLSETPHIPGSKSWDSARPRFVNYVDLRDDSGREFRVWNGHLDHIGQVARENQARLIVEASEALPPDLPQLFTADCNAEASNRAVQNVIAGGWTDTYAAIHGPEDPGITYHAFLGPGYAGKTTGKIDFIFSRGPVETLACEIIRDSRDGRYPSDHYFLSAELRF
jgi:endonuclease/exonuclease/phosphatase family metal-dependent hydrolase